MNLLPDDVQQSLVDAAVQVLADRFPVRRLLEPGGGRVDPTTWRQLADLGWLGLGLDTSVGGTGLGAAEESLVFVELGRHLVPGPFLSTVLAAHAALDTGRPDLAAILVAGGSRAAMLVPATGGGAADQLVDSGMGDRDRGVGDRDRGVGEPDRGVGRGGVGRAGVGSGGPADGGGEAAAWVLDLSGGGPVLSPASAFAVTERIDCIDPAVELVAVQRRGPADGPPAGAGLRARAAVLAAAFQVGIADAALAASCAYARDRHQFGQPIGAFQAVKHRCADMAARVEAARSITALAALQVDAHDPAAPFHAAAAKALADGAARANAAANVQNHGGIGFTWDHGAHLLVARAEVVGQLVLSTRAALHDVLAATSPAASPAG